MTERGDPTIRATVTKRLNSSETGNLCAQQLQIGPRLKCPTQGAGRRLDVRWQHRMQIDYARYPDGGCYDGSGAEQNPAYRVSGNRPSGRFF